MQEILGLSLMPGLATLNITKWKTDYLYKKRNNVKKEKKKKTKRFKPWNTRIFSRLEIVRDFMHKTKQSIKFCFSSPETVN